MTASPAMFRFVEERAGRRCEYCQMHAALQGATFHVEHVIPLSRGGKTEADNLALACPSCNLHKADQLNRPRRLLIRRAEEVFGLFPPRNP